MATSKSSKRRPSKHTTSEYWVITPAKAKKLLADSWLTQRRIDWTVVIMYAEMMKRGLWNDTPGIGFDCDRKLVDGHHRLHAIIRSGVSVRLLVIQGMSKNAILGIDIGIPRSVAFQLKTEEEHYGEKKISYKSSVISYVNMCNYLLAQRRVRIRHSSMFRRFHQIFREEVEWALSECLSNKILRHGTVGGALAFAYATNPKKVKQFTTFLRDPTTLPPKHPARALYLHLSELDPTDHSSTYRFPVAKRVLNAVLAFIEKRSCRDISDSDDGLKHFSEVYLEDDAVRDLFNPWLPKKSPPNSKNSKLKLVA